MFEVVIKKTDGLIETWDCISEMQAECVFFKSRMSPDTDYVEINEIVEIKETT